MGFPCTKTNANPPTCAVHGCVLVPQTVFVNPAAESNHLLVLPEGQDGRRGIVRYQFPRGGYMQHNVSIPLLQVLVSAFIALLVVVLGQYLHA